MSRSHKSVRPLLVVTLTLLAVLALLAPVAMAAPEVVHGVSITGVSPKVTNTPGTRIRVDYAIEVVRTQAYDVEVTASLMKNGFTITSSSEIIAANRLKEGSNAFCFGPEPPTGICTAPGLLVPPMIEGWYDLMVCVEGDGAVWCDQEAKAVLVDYTPPGAQLIKPEEGAWVTGRDYLLVGRASDPDAWGTVASVVFEYCSFEAFRQPDECANAWIKIADGKPTPGIPGQYDGRWDTLQVPDDEGYVRICARDGVGNKGCSEPHRIYLVNTYSIELHAGWNLISTPLIPYDNNIENVMLHLAAKSLVNQVLTMDRDGQGGYNWTSWNPDPAVPDSLTKFRDGKGYWIEMKAPATLWIEGTWTGLQPPTYSVVPDWNLIGYTVWGVPPRPEFGDKTVLEYIGAPLWNNAAESFWRYDAGTGLWVQMLAPDDMFRGAGYWLATAAGGTINP